MKRGVKWFAREVGCITLGRMMLIEHELKVTFHSLNSILVGLVGPLYCGYTHIGAVASSVLAPASHEPAEAEPKKSGTSMDGTEDVATRLI